MKIRIEMTVTVPVRGIRLHTGENQYTEEHRPGYCPREGYKAASFGLRSFSGCIHVTVPVRGIRLHHEDVDDLFAHFDGRLLSP